MTCRPEHSVFVPFFIIFLQRSRLHLRIFQPSSSKVCMQNLRPYSGIVYPLGQCLCASNFCALKNYIFSHRDSVVLPTPPGESTRREYCSFILQLWKPSFSGMSAFNVFLFVAGKFPIERIHFRWNGGLAWTFPVQSPGKLQIKGFRRCKNISFRLGTSCHSQMNFFIFIGHDKNLGVSRA